MLKALATAAEKKVAELEAEVERQQTAVDGAVEARQIGKDHWQLLHRARTKLDAARAVLAAIVEARP